MSHLDDLYTEKVRISTQIDSVTSEIRDLYHSMDPRTSHPYTETKEAIKRKKEMLENLYVARNNVNLQLQTIKSGLYEKLQKEAIN